MNQARIDRVNRAMDKLREVVDVKNIIRVGPGAAAYLKVPLPDLNHAVNKLADEEFRKFYVPMGELEDTKTSIKVLAAPGTTFSEIVKRRDEILTIENAEKKVVTDSRARKIIGKIETRDKNKKRKKDEVESMVFDMRVLKRKGYSNVAIANMYGLNESTVRRHLKKPLTREELLVETMISAVHSGRDHIVGNVVNTQAFRNVFGFDYGVGYFIKQSKPLITVAFEETNDKPEKMKFTLEFEVKKVVDNR